MFIEVNMVSLYNNKRFDTSTATFKVCDYRHCENTLTKGVGNLYRILREAFLRPEEYVASHS